MKQDEGQPLLRRSVSHCRVDGSCLRGDSTGERLQLRFSAFQLPEQVRPPDVDQVPVPVLPESRPRTLALSCPREMLAATVPFC